MDVRNKRDFDLALKDIIVYSSYLSNPFDRVRCTEWIRKLVELANSDDSNITKCNEYMQLLRLQVKHQQLHGPFRSPPPKEILTLVQSLSDCLIKRIPKLRQSGSLAPVFCHKSPDGRAYVSCKQIAGGGVFCYLAVSPDGLSEENQN